MSLRLLALILLAAVLHASWNFFAKRSGGSLGVIWLGAVISTAATIPVAIVLNDRPLVRDGVLLACVSGVVHCAYWWALARMYAHGDISLAYPVARGTGVMGTALGALVLRRETMSAPGAAGVAAVCAGVLAIGYHRRGEVARARSVMLAVVTGVTIMAYTLLDDRGVDRLSPPVYLAIETGVGALLLGVFGWRTLRMNVAEAYRLHGKTAWIIGIGSPVTYLIILYAYMLGPVGYITAVREFSVVVAALMGAWLLHEKLSRLRWAGIALVVLGMVLIKTA